MVVVVLDMARRFVGLLSLPVVAVEAFTVEHSAAVSALHIYRGDSRVTAGQAERRFNQPNDPQFGIFIMHGRTL